MSRTLVAIVAVLAVFAVLYLTLPQDMRYEIARTQPRFTKPESNGIIGRFMDGVKQSMWYPVEFIAILSAIIVGTSCMAIYWRSVRD